MLCGRQRAYDNVSTFFCVQIAVATCALYLHLYLCLPVYLHFLDICFCNYYYYYFHHRSHVRFLPPRRSQNRCGSDSSSNISMATSSRGLRSRAASFAYLRSPALQPLPYLRGE